jgi:hypothetical protein
VTRSQGQKLVALAGEEWIGGHNQRIAPLAHQRLEGRVDLALGAGIEKVGRRASGSRRRIAAAIIRRGSFSWVEAFSVSGAQS